MKIIVYTDGKGGYTGFRAQGHAEYTSEGYDEVCDAVSVLLVNFVNSVEKFTDDEFSFEDSMEENDTVSFSMKGKASPETELLFRSVLLGIRNIISKYGDDYVTLYFAEKNNKRGVLP